MLRDTLQEAKELGLLGTAFRLGWELRQRTGFTGRLRGWGEDPNEPLRPSSAEPWAERLPFADPRSVVDAMRDRIPPQCLDRLRETASDAMRGRIRCFGRWRGDYGDPIDWHRNPLTGATRSSGIPSTQVVVDDPKYGDVKLMWEAGRFPHAYHTARAAAFFPDDAQELSRSLLGQIEQFIGLNPEGRGIHWNSGQEVAIRSLSWLFALDSLLLYHAETTRAPGVLGPAIWRQARHVREHIAFARIAVNNNHLLAEALFLFVSGALFAGHSGARAAREEGYAILTGEADRQFYEDGGYLNLSHNYHRVVLQHLLWACRIAHSTGNTTSPRWLAAMDRSLRFLLAHMNPSDGRLPNYGFNDGSYPSALSTCDFSDFRPTLQAVSIACRSERVFDAGPWDEEAAWTFGPSCLDLPLRRPVRTSVSFNTTGFHVLRSKTEDGTYASFRCGSLRDRFSQIDMLHVDVFWKGHNVLVDGGSYLYNGPREWHDHFFETASHNTISVDGRDQMKHYRKFKCLYWTRARLLGFDRQGEWTLASGEHYGFQHYPGGCVHRRSVAFHDSGLGVVRDTLFGDGAHRVRLHWLAGPFPWRFEANNAELVLDTGGGDFSVRILQGDGRPATADVVAGQALPPRGWLSRYYGEKVPVPSLASEVMWSCPVTFFTVFGPGHLEATAGPDWVELKAGPRIHRFALTSESSLALA